LPDSIVARSALAHDAASSDVAESLEEQPERINAVEITATDNNPKRFFTVAPISWP
jgi:hypothetical protein